MQTIHDVIIEVLTITDYPKDKEKFAKDFEALNSLDAMLILYNALPQEQQEIIKAHNYDSATFLHYLSQEAYQTTLQEVTERELANLLRSLVPKLTQTKKEKVTALISSL